MSEGVDLLSHRATNARRNALSICLASLALLGVVMVAVSCSLGGSITAPVTRPSPSPGLPVRSKTPQPTVTVQPTPTVFGLTLPVTLTIWLPPDMALSAQSGGQALQEANESFETANPGIFIEIVPKAAYGAGGLANALIATRPVVPSRLPDIIAIDTAQADVLVAQGLLVPLDDLLPGSIWQDLYPSAATAISSTELGAGVSAIAARRYAIPFQVDIGFVAYNTSNIPLAPRTWTDMEGLEVKYVFPASQGAGDAADAFLLQYLAEGGELLSEGGRPYLDSAIVARVLTVYRQAVDAGVVPITVRNLQTVQDCWDAYMQDKATMTNVSSWLYQRERSALRRTRYAPIPTTSGVSSTLARSWSWAIVTDDPIRQQIASQYILAVLSPHALASWCSQSYHLPAHRAAMALVIEDESYRTFLEELLKNAHPYPDLSYYTGLQSIIIRAIEDVLDGVSTPERAAVTAAAMVARLR